MCLRAAASASPFGVGSVWSVPCGMIFPRPCAGCGGLASAAKAPIGPTCTTCAGQARNGTPSTAAWPKRMELAGQAGGRIAPTRTAPNVRYRHPSLRIGTTPNLASQVRFTSRPRKPVSSGRRKPLISGSSGWRRPDHAPFLAACFRGTVVRRLQNRSIEWGWKHGNSLRDPR